MSSSLVGYSWHIPSNVPDARGGVTYLDCRHSAALQRHRPGELSWLNTTARSVTRSHRNSSIDCSKHWERESACWIRPHGPWEPPGP